MSTLQQVVFTQDATQAAPAHPHWRKTVRVQCVWEGVRRQKQHDPSHAPALRNQAVLMPAVLQGFHKETSPENTLKLPHWNQTVLMQQMRATFQSIK